MTRFARLRSLWRNLVHRTAVERDLDDEIRGTLALLEDEYRQRGLPPAEARRTATLQLGRVDMLKDNVRDVRAGALLEGVVRDAGYGLRVLRRNPLFAAAAAASLAIGIGATTTIFTVANGLLLRVAPGVSDPAQLVDIVPTRRGNFGIVFATYDIYREIRERVTTLEDIYGYQLEPQPRSLRDGGAAERVFAGVVTPNYFSALRVPAAAGRVFETDDDRAGDDRTIVLSHDFWTQRFGRDPAIVGRALYLNGEPFVVLGVARAGFRGMSVAAPDLWVAADRTASQLMIGGRLKPGVGRAEASAELRAAGTALGRDRPDAFAQIDWSVAASSPLPATLRGIAAAFIGLLLALVTLVLVIACTNVAGVLLARATARRREIAVRVAIGAGRARLVRQLMTETCLLFAIGAVGGVALARVMVATLLAVLPAFPVPINLALPLDGRVLAFALGLSLAAALLSGIAPALHASKADVVTALKDESQGPSDRLRLRHAFVMAQVAVSILLVVAAGLLGRALGRVTAADQGFDPRGVDTASVDLSMAGYTDATGRAFLGDLRDGVRRLPGVEAATMADRLPGGPVRIDSTLRDRGAPVPGQPSTPPSSWTLIGPEYFSTLRIPIVAGREFTAADRRGMPAVAIVDESTARRLFPGEDAVGRFLPVVSGRVAAQDGSPRQIVGVVRDVTGKSRRREMAVLYVYAPLQQVYSSQITILARSRTGERVVGALRGMIRTLDPNLPVLSAQGLSEQQQGPVMLQLRIAAVVSACVGVVGLLLASIGIYGVTAYTTSRRTREIGIRLTLGARPADVTWLILRQGLTLVAIGAAVGLTLAAVASRVLARLLFGLPPLDPVTFGGATLLFAAVGLAACYLPAHRATRLSVVDALRHE